MNEFNNRIDAQRQIVDSINRKFSGTEEMFGLSSKAIARWVAVNHVDGQSRLVHLIIAASGKLFFLANKSQEQVTNEYRLASEEIEELAASIEQELEAAPPRTLLE